jgi:heptosyltransferase-1
MGDIIHAMVALQYIKKAIPNSQIDWLVEKSFVQVLQNNPHIDNILPVHLKGIKSKDTTIIEQYKLLKKYATNNYDVVIDAQGLMKSALASWILGERIVGSFTAGFDKDSIREKPASWFYTKKVYIGYDQNTIDRNVKVLSEPLGFEIKKDDILEKEPFLFTNETFDEDDYMVFVVGSTWESRNYPKEKFLEIAERLKDKVIVVWGNKDEEEKAKWLESNSEYITMAPRGNLEKLKAIIQNAKLLIGNDTGPTHMAWGFNVPSITIFGPTPVNRIYITDINKAVKSSSHVNHYKLDKNDFSICEIESKEIVELAKGLI